jgi:ubiquinone/menaquinone biosynthesis C-methylase UbiE
LRVHEREYDTLRQLEDYHWWYADMRDLVCSNIPVSRPSALQILDAGCGTGGMLAVFKNHGIAYGIDISERALLKCRERNLPRLIQASVMNIPFGDESFDFVLSSDVLYHRCVRDDASALREFFRVLKPSGKLILHLPALPFLLSSHDRAIHTRKRYNRSEIDQLLKTGGFRPEKLTYRMFFLFPLILFWRTLKKGSSTPEPLSDLRKNSRYHQ